MKYINELTGLIDRYCGNMDRQKALDDMLFEKCDKSEWVGRLRERSKALFEISEDNGRLLELLRERLDAELTPDEAEMLYQRANRMYEEDYDDYTVLYPILERLLRVYEPTDDYEKRLFLYKAIFYEQTEIRNRGSGEMFSTEDMLYKIFDLKDKYASLSEEARRVFWVSYYNYVVIDTENANFDVNRSYQRYREFIDFWNSDTVQEIDGKNENFAAVVSLINSDWMCVEEYFDDADVEVKEFLTDFAERAFRKEQESCADITDYNDRTYALYLRTRIEAGDESYESALEKYMDYYRRCLERFEASEGLNVEQQHFLNNGPVMMVRWSKQLDDGDKRREIIDTLIENTKSTLFTGFKDFPSQFINEVLAKWCFTVLGYLPDAATKEEWLFGLLVRRQLPTYLHSVMVSKLAERYARAAMECIPDFFDALPQEQKRDIPDYLRRCGLFHDIGKSRIADIINLQGRKLDDEEFSSIKRHPDFGAFVLEKDSDLLCFRDVARGHHRFYDGSGGYPADYDPSASCYRSAVDIITICDCIDAATDYLGRNYKRAKTTDEIVQELRRDAGKRYEPRLVELLDTAPGLMEDIRYLTGEGRADIMYEAYRESWERI